MKNNDQILDVIMRDWPAIFFFLKSSVVFLSLSVSLRDGSKFVFIG